MSDSPASEDDAIPTEKPDRSGLKTVPSLVVVNTGHGKGKSTAAFGTMLRAVALDWPVAVVQFLKSGDWNTGEEKVARSIGVDWFAAGDGFTWNWIAVGAVVETILDRPEKVNIVLTGRDMPEPIIDIAHTVTEMTKIKHAFDEGIVAKKGIDY